ncbi:MAG: hypothetical protein M0017_01130 [Desulfobacteraceae bacterium]|nr:hypothetical protein [Desulfobacteraceae bacterium]
MKNRTMHILALSQLLMLGLFFCMTILNEVVDLPHYLFGDTPTVFGQRLGEMLIEGVIFTLVMTTETVIILKAYSRIPLLEGFLPLCANCKKIRHQDQWQQMEKYITEHSLAQFSHSICPECAAKLYPEIHPGTWRSKFLKSK